jgi:hypothetical protein
MNCPRCGGNLEVKRRVSEYRDFTVIGNSIAIGDVTETSDCELIHISCDNCSTYWYSESEFLAEVTKGK